MADCPPLASLTFGHERFRQARSSHARPGTQRAPPRAEPAGRWTAARPGSIPAPTTSTCSSSSSSSATPVKRHAQSALAHSGGRGHAPLRKPSRLPRAALWPREERFRRVGAEESLRLRCCPKSPISPPLTLQAPASRACCTSSSSAPSRGARRTRSASSSARDSSRSAGRSSSCRFGTPPARSASARSPAMLTRVSRGRRTVRTGYAYQPLRAVHAGSGTGQLAPGPPRTVRTPHAYQPWACRMTTGHPQLLPRRGGRAARVRHRVEGHVHARGQLAARRAHARGHGRLHCTHRCAAPGSAPDSP